MENVLLINTSSSSLERNSILTSYLLRWMPKKGSFFIHPLARAILTIFFSIFKCLSAELCCIFFSVFSQKSKSRINWPLTSSNVRLSLPQQVVINSFSRLIPVSNFSTVDSVYSRPMSSRHFLLCSAYIPNRVCFSGFLP